ncbi:hypothetical protein T492DRAFT_983642 [Pavlovales sp. CCMP2436]|nr:hypothetical protein T492DRAFT_983642 [Pavlovales sp. CCMP2436]
MTSGQFSVETTCHTQQHSVTYSNTASRSFTVSQCHRQRHKQRIYVCTTKDKSQQEVQTQQ